MEVRTITKKNYTWDEVGDILEAGKGEEAFGLGKMTVKVEGVGTAVLKILDYDKDKSAMDPTARTATVWFKRLEFDERPFDENGSNQWAKCSLRKDINSVEFKSRFEEGFRKLLTPVLKKNDGGEDTLDTFFLFSREELEGEGRYRGIETEKDRIKVNPEGETDWHWTRSAYRDIAGLTCFVNPSGSVYGSTATGALRFDPACVLSKHH